MAPGGQGSNSSGVLALNGGNYVEVASNAAQQVAANQDFTYEMWVKPNAFTSNNTYFENGNWNASLTILFRQNSTTDIHLYINGTDRGGINYVPPTGTWTHLALVRSGGASGILTLYADGVSKGTFTAYASAIATTAAMRIGSSVHIGTQLFNGSIDEFRFFKGVALSTTTLDAWRNRELTSSHPNWANVSFEYKFSGNTNNSQGGSPAGTGVGTIAYAAANFYTFAFSGSGTWTTSGAPAAATNEVQSAVPTQVSIGTNGSGTYTCIVSRSGYTSSAASAATASVTVQPVPQGSLSGNTICGDGNANGQLVWTATSGTGPYTVVWNTTSANYPGWGNQSTSSVTSGTAFSNSPTPVVSTTYSLVSVTGANGCARSSSFTTSNGTITVAGPSSGYTLTDFATAGITGFVAPAAVGITWGDDATMATISYTATTWPNCVNYGFGRPSINTAATANPLNLDLRDATNTDLSAGKASFVGTASFQYMSGGANTTQTLSVRCRIIASKALQYFPTQNACMLKANSNFNLQVQMEVLVPSSPALQFPVSGYAAGSWAPVILFCNTVHPPNVTPNIYTSLPTATGSATTSFSTVNALPTLPTASSNTPVCSGSTLSLSSSNGSLTTCTSPLNYSWTGPNSFTSTSSSPSIPSVTSAAGGVYTLEISSATNRVCYSRVTTSTVVINTTPAVTNMTASACSGSGFTATPVNSTNGVVPAGTTYSWAAPSVTGGLTGGTTGSGASSITGTLTNPTNTAQTATYTVTPTASGCPGATFTVMVTINPTPAVTAMTASTCSGTGFTATPVNSTNGIVPTGTTYSWAAPSVTGGLTGGSTGSGASSISGTLTNPTNTAQTATYTVTPTSGGCPGSTFTVTATINPKPAVTAMTASACSGSGFTATPVNSTNGVVPTGTTYSWAAPSVTGGLTGGSTGSGASSITGTLTNPTNTAQTATYTVTPTAGSCTGSTFTLTVTINTTPAVTNMTASSCSGSGFTATPVNSTNGVVPTGTTYSWAAPSVTGGLTGGTTGSGASSITGTLTNPSSTAQTATYTVTPTAGSCPGATFTVTVTINPKPAVTNLTATVCSGVGFTSTPVDVTDGIVPSGTTYSWAAPSVTGGLTGGSTGSSASSISGTLNNPTLSPQTGTYTVTPSAGGCSGSTFTVTATINPLPAAAITPATVGICIGSSTTLTASGGSSYVWNTGPTTAGITVSPTTATTYSVVVTNGYTCTASASSTVTVNPLPTPTVSPATSVCAGTVGLVYTTQSGMTGYSWSVTGGSITAGGGSTNNTATVTWGAAGTGHVLINYTDGNGCTAAASTDQSITIDQAVTADADVTNLAVPGASSTQIEVCGALGTSLVANNPSLGTGTWTQVAGAGTTTYAPNANANSVTTTISGYSAPAAVTYRWTVVNGACSASSDVVVVYDPAIVINSVLAGCSFVPLPPFSNDSIMILVTATGGSSTLSFSYPPTDELRINVNSGTKVYTAPTDGNSHSFTVSDAFCAQSSAQTTPSTHITDIPFTSSTGVDSAKCFDKNFNKWVTFRDASNNAFLSINDNNQDLGQVTVITYRDATAASISNASTNVCPGVQSVAMKRHFVITATNPPTSPVTLRLYFTPGELSDLISDAQANDLSGNSCTHLDNIYNINELYVTKYTGTLEDGDYTNNDAAGTYKVYGNTTLLPTQPDGPLSKYSNGFSSLFDSGDPHHYVELTVNEFSEIWLHGSQNATPLPTEMIYFEANPIDNSFIRLTWATAIEINNSGFEVERSLDGINWSQIAWVDGHNNSSVQQNYVYNDYNVQASVRYYYRLKKVDNDGAGEYTSVVSAIISGNFSFTVKDFMPNPASGESKLAVLANGQQTVGVAIYNYLGQVVLQQDFDLHKGGNELKFDLSRLAAGSYTALLTSQTNTYTKKLVITR